VGKKTAERLALELKDKVMEMGATAPETTGHGVRGDVLSALMNLGYRQRDAETALKLVSDPDAEFETLLRQTLRTLAR
jgi:Holliday junction DNA helicase RuvA